jgi:hypothetical protein
LERDAYSQLIDSGVTLNSTIGIYLKDIVQDSFLFDHAIHLHGKNLQVNGQLESILQVIQAVADDKVLLYIEELKCSQVFRLGNGKEEDIGRKRTA